MRLTMRLTILWHQVEQHQKSLDIFTHFCVFNKSCFRIASAPGKTHYWAPEEASAHVAQQLNCFVNMLRSPGFIIPDINC